MSYSPADPLSGLQTATAIGMEERTEYVPEDM